MKTVWMAVLAAALAAPAAAQEKGQLGAGLMLGDPTSGTVKYWLNDREALQGGLGVSSNLVLHADYARHFWDVVGKPAKGRLALYVALGGRYEDVGGGDFGIRALPGLSYWPALKRPVEFFLEIGPSFRLTHDTRVRVDGGFGGRIYFKPGKLKDEKKP